MFSKVMSDQHIALPAAAEMDGGRLGDERATNIISYFETNSGKEGPLESMKSETHARQRRASRISAGDNCRHSRGDRRILPVVRPQKRFAGSRRRHDHVSGSVTGRRDRDSIGTAGSSGFAADRACLRACNGRPRHALKVSTVSRAPGRNRFAASQCCAKEIAPSHPGSEVEVNRDGAEVWGLGSTPPRRGKQTAIMIRAT